jgi:CIC family chloride channel protein
MRSTLLKSLGSWLASAGGGSIGREGPLILFGGSLGDRAADAFRLDDHRARVLTAAGTAAGFAAAYNTPLAAVLFVLEVVAGVVAIDAILASIVGAAVATTVTRVVLGAGPIYGQRDFAPASSTELVAYAALGLVAALGARAFMALLSSSEELFARSRIAQPWRAALGGFLVGALAVWLPEVAGNGYEPLNRLLDGGLALSFVVVLLLAKSLATAASVGSGSPGGVFTPTLLVGAGLGLCVHHGLAALDLTSLGRPPPRRRRTRR